MQPVRLTIIASQTTDMQILTAVTNEFFLKLARLLDNLNLCGEVRAVPSTLKETTHTRAFDICYLV